MLSDSQGGAEAQSGVEIQGTYLLVIIIFIDNLYCC